MGRKINIGEKSKVNIKWNVLPMDYSHEAEENIRVKFAKKYGIPKENVSIEPQLIVRNAEGEEVVATNGIMEDIQNPLYQQSLFKAYLDERGVENYDFEKIIEIDNLINSKIDYEVYDSHRRYTIKWIKWSNFMSYGEDNFFDFTSLNGLVLLTSNPANQGGKTTFCLDLFRFLLYGKVTSRESDWTLSKLFNKHLPEATEVTVEGCINIDGQDYVIKRTVTRPALKKRTDKSKVSQKINYYRLVNGEYIDMLDDENLTENEAEQGTRMTNKIIKEAIGNERDFDLMICVDSDNLKGLISLKDTDRGRLISRWIGLLPLEEKEKLAKDEYNHRVLPSLVLNRFNKEELKSEIEDLTKENEENSKTLTDVEKEHKKISKKIDKYQEEREQLLVSKQQIDPALTKIDVQTLETKIEQIKFKGQQKRAEKKRNQERLSEFADVQYNENEYQEVINEDKKVALELNSALSEYKMISQEIETLKKGEFCPTCGAKLQNVNNAEAISLKSKKLEELKKVGSNLRERSKELTDLKAEIEEKRKSFNEKSKIELLIATNDVDINKLLTEYKEATTLLENIEKNKNIIANNNEIDAKLNILATNISVEKQLLTKNEETQRDIKTKIEINKKTIVQHGQTIERIEKEEIIDRNWRIYLDIIGKNGISKLVLRKALPLVNGELKRILNGVCDFDIEVKIDADNSVAFYLIHEGVYSNLGSGSGFEQTVASLALRSVLSKISTFSKPSFVVFDEVLGGVAEENYDKVKLLYDKIVQDYQCILFITHNSVYKEWANSIISVTKEKNISKISQNVKQLNVY
jgi:DNA repair exonuclease SbcCD ATPase subunit